MTIELKIFTSKDKNPEGFPLAFEIAHTQDGKERKRQIGIGRCLPEHFLKSEKSISSRHPDYDILEPKIKAMKARAKRIVLQGIADVETAKRMMKLDDIAGQSFQDFSTDLIKDMREVAEKLLKRGDEKAANRKLGNIKVYENTISQFRSTVGDLSFSEIDYNQILKFRNYQEGLGNSKSTVHHYLRTLRAIYNKGLLKHRILDEKPFKGTFSGLKIKSYESNKKYISKESIIALERMDLSKTPAVERSRDLWLLQFYFGGADLMDIYYLENRQLRKGRIFFSRSKTDSSLMIDLAIHPKAEKIISRHKATEGAYLFPWRKDIKGYETFRRNTGQDLIKIQEANKIDILPAGGNLGIKVARHSFANLAKKKNLEQDLIREIMGHERDDVDNFYKDRFDAETRDAGLYEVISSFDCTSEIFQYEKPGQWTA